MHLDKCPEAGKLFTVHGFSDEVDGGDMTFRVEDWWDRFAGKSWMESTHDRYVAYKYAVRSLVADLPIDDEVVYGRSVSSGLGHIVHISELENYQ